MHPKSGTSIIDIFNPANYDNVASFNSILDFVDLKDRKGLNFDLKLTIRSNNTGSIKWTVLNYLPDSFKEWVTCVNNEIIEMLIGNDLLYEGDRILLSNISNGICFSFNFRIDCHRDEEMFAIIAQLIDDILGEYTELERIDPRLYSKYYCRERFGKYMTKFGNYTLTWISEKPTKCAVDIAAIIDLTDILSVQPTLETYVWTSKLKLCGF